MAIFDEIQVRVYRSYIKLPLIFFVPLLTLLSAFSLAYFHVNSPHFWRATELQLHEVMGGHFALGYVEFSPTLTGVEVYDAHILTEEREPVIAADHVQARLNPLMLMTERIEFSHGRVDGARVRLAFDDNGELNLLRALGIYERMRSRDREDDVEQRRSQAVGFRDIELQDVVFEFSDPRFDFQVDAADIPRASISVEPTAVIMSVDELKLPGANFRFRHQLFKFPEERGDWEFRVDNFEVYDWRWVNEGFTVDRVIAEVDGIRAEAGGRMVFPDDDGERNMLYDARGTLSADYQSTVLDYFTAGNIKFDIPRLDVEVTGDFHEIMGELDVYGRVLNLNGIQIENISGPLRLENRFIIAEELTGEFYGGDLRAQNGFFSILDARYGAELFVDRSNPRALLKDMLGEDQPFLDGQLTGGLSIVGEIPRSMDPRPGVLSPILTGAMVRFATMEVIDDLVLHRNQDLLFPNQTLTMHRGGRFWVDQRRLGLPYARLTSGPDRFEVRDFIMDYERMNFAPLGGSGPAHIEAYLADIEPYAIYYGLDGLFGPAQFSMTMEGFFGSPDWHLLGSMEEPGWRLADGRELSGKSIDLELITSDGVIGVEQLTADTEFGTFDVRGEVGWFEPPPAPGDPRPWPIWEDRPRQPLELSIDIAGLEMATISDLIHPAVQAQGNLEGRLELGGHYGDLRGDFEARFGPGIIRSQKVENLAFRGAFERGGVRLFEAQADLGAAGRYRGAGRYGFDNSFEFELDGRAVELAELRELDDMPMALGGTTGFHLKGEGDGQNVEFSGGGQVRQLAVDDRVYGDMAITADTLDEVVFISGGLLPWLTVAVEIPLRGPAPFYARLGMEQLELMDFLPEVGEHPMLDDAVVSGTTELFFERDFSRYQAIFNLTDLRADSRGQMLTNRGPVIVGYNNGEVLNFQRVVLESGGRLFSLEGAVGFDPALLDVRVEGDLDLALLQSARAGFPEFFPDYFVDAAGYAKTDMTVRGTVENFVADGQMDFGASDWELRFLPEPIALEAGTLLFDAQGITIPSDRPLRGTMLGGATRVAGELGLFGDEPHPIDLQVWSHNMSYRIPNLATLAFDTNLNIEARDFDDWESWLISGEIDILDGEYFQQFNIVEQQLAGRVIGAFQPRTDQYEAGLFELVPILNDIRFDVMLRARDGFRFISEVERMEMDLELRFDLWIQDTLVNPRVTGDLDVIDGAVTFQGESFEVRSGTVRFIDDMSNPYVEIQAGADVRNTCDESDYLEHTSSAMTLTSNFDATDQRYYHIVMNIQGRLDNLDFHLESNPYADQRDILSLLLTGCTVDELTASGASRPTLEVALGPLLGRLEREIQDVVAVDEFTITPGVERTQVRIGDTLSRRLSWGFQLDTGFADATGSQQTRLELKLSDRWTVEMSERSHTETNNVLLDMKLNYRLPLD